MKPWTFVHVADLQPGSPKSYRYNPSWIKNWEMAKQQILKIMPDLLLVGGDITRDGSIHKYELEEMKANLDSLPFPYYVIPGNMDTGNKHVRHSGHYRGENQCSDIELNVTSTQLQQFSNIFGELWWSIEHKGVRFSGCPDVLINSGLPEENLFWTWAEEQIRQTLTEHHVWITHYPLFIESLNEGNWDISTPKQYHDWYFSIDNPGRMRLMELFKATATDIVVSGHVHCHKVSYAEKIRFEIAPATSFGQWGDRWHDGNAELGFLRYDVIGKEIKSTFIPLEKTYALEGYGPGGHPAPHVRDYSIAWEKS
ncbi:MAG: hypothetical protein UT30_C0024G0012 [Candidatus Uhrbacteria bacterium GW2011_GWF2_39_13]|uniref:Calcineurin-like phosphoesterase domain-containing protein n=1 Tax=Candidatus Uhrbacteria bacterium GW2011_GWF2_39_13 TaxID=1618995 RepID=A0A0G0QPR4_9BACT|nr:MAG: hypothetical protein UT30_C0024G0012 [Candidatus Uhrbacteria bacterium GW2011_GWF2_39_13]